MRHSAPRSAVGMAWPALLVAVVVPAAVHALRRSPLWERIGVTAAAVTWSWVDRGEREAERQAGGDPVVR
ncbi:hypothetical protein [Streptomyces sp. F-1]|uniref:hypothetical protein n=1 Tax=Streptomyces sp. F-1 TaxID=463642 RepID=UPI00086C90A9|nr:hypothetical protein [Streptomyces sp. F-1]SFY52126.1 hypothetical protein STEPF1_05396 [Streptomyces sp. F-1]